MPMTPYNTVQGARTKATNLHNEPITTMYPITYLDQQDPSIPIPNHYDESIKNLPILHYPSGPAQQCPSLQLHAL